MFVYEKKLQFPVNIKNVNPRLAAIILEIVIYAVIWRILL